MVLLLVVDVQNDYFGENAKINFQDQFSKECTGNHQKTFGTPNEYLGAVNGIIQREAAAGKKIVYIREELPNTLFFRKVFGHSLKGTEGVKRHRTLCDLPGTEFTKMFGSAFSSRKFAAYVKTIAPDEIYIIGCDSAKCAFLTAKDAAKKGYTVKMLADGLFSFFPQLTGKCEEELTDLGVEYISFDE